MSDDADSEKCRVTQGNEKLRNEKLRNEAVVNRVETTCCHQMETYSLNADSAETQRTREKGPKARATQSIAVVWNDKLYLRVS